MNPRLSINVTTTWQWDLGQCIEAYARLGIPAIGFTLQSLEAYGVDKGLAHLSDAGLRVASFTGVGPFVGVDAAQRKANLERAGVATDLGARLKADCVYVMTGPRRELSWEAAAVQFKEALAEVLPGGA